MRQHTTIALCLASLIAGMFMGSFFINRHTVELCQQLSERAER